MLLHELREQDGEAIVLIPVHAADFLAAGICAHGSHYMPGSGYLLVCQSTKTSTAFGLLLTR